MSNGQNAQTAWRVVGRRVQVRRARLNRQQNEIPGVSRNTVSRLERGQPISLVHLARIEGELGFDEHELVNAVFGDPARGGDADSIAG